MDWKVPVVLLIAAIVAIVAVTAVHTGTVSDSSETVFTSADYEKIPMEHELTLFDRSTNKMTEYHIGDPIAKNDVLIIDMVDSDPEELKALVESSVLNGYKVATVNSAGHLFDNLADDVPIVFDYGSCLNMMYIEGGVTYCYSNTSDNLSDTLFHVGHFIVMPEKNCPHILKNNHCSINYLSVSDIRHESLGWIRSSTLGGQWNHPYQLNYQGNFNYRGTVSDGYFTLTRVSTHSDGITRTLDSVDYLGSRLDPNEHMWELQIPVDTVRYDPLNYAWAFGDCIYWGPHQLENVELHVYPNFEVSLDCSQKTSGSTDNCFGEMFTLLPSESGYPNFDGSMTISAHVSTGDEHACAVFSIERTQPFMDLSPSS